ncbi:AAA-ATPase-like domain-containing protein, partial [Endogone sp. FLAS-F59071]
MLAHFHGVEYSEHYDELFKGLAVDQDVQAGTIMPYQYLILSLDFSAVDRDPDPKFAKVGLHEMINNSIGDFYRTYACYLGNKTDDQLIESLIHPNNAISSLQKCVSTVRASLRAVKGNLDHPLAGVKGIYLLADEYDAFANEYMNLKDTTGYDSIHREQSSLKDFWACVKASMGHQKITKCFITGVLPLSLADATSGFNIATNVSSKRELAGLCGLSSGDVRSALKTFCSNGEVEK